MMIMPLPRLGSAPHVKQRRDKVPAVDNGLQTARNDPRSPTPLFQKRRTKKHSICMHMPPVKNQRLHNTGTAYMAHNTTARTASTGPDTSFYVSDLASHGFQMGDQIDSISGNNVALSSLIFSATKFPCDTFDSCLDIKNSDVVSVKVLDKNTNGIALWMKIRQEVTTHRLASSHVNILTLYQVFETYNAVYFILEPTSKGMLASNIPSSGMIESRCRRIFTGIVHGLEYLHQQNITHGNLSCKSIFLSADDTPRISEFGLAIKLPMRNGDKIPTMPIDDFKAPEVIVTRRSGGFAADIWSIGTVLYVMLYNVMPYVDTTDMIARQQQELNFTHRRVTFEVRRLIKEMLSFNPRQRPITRHLLDDPWFSVDMLANIGKEQQLTKQSSNDSVHIATRTTPNRRSVIRSPRTSGHEPIALLSRGRSSALGAFIRLESRAVNSPRHSLILSQRSIVRVGSAESVSGTGAAASAEQFGSKTGAVPKPEAVPLGSCTRLIPPGFHVVEPTVNSEHKLTTSASETGRNQPQTSTLPKVPYVDDIVQHRTIRPWMNDVDLTYQPPPPTAADRLGAASLSSRDVYCQSAQCRRELLSERALFESTSAPLGSSISPISSAGWSTRPLVHNLADIYEDTPLMTSSAGASSDRSAQRGTRLYILEAMSESKFNEQFRSSHSRLSPPSSLTTASEPDNLQQQQQQQRSAKWSSSTLLRNPLTVVHETTVDSLDEGNPNQTGRRSRHQVVEEQQEAQLWESLSQRSVSRQHLPRLAKTQSVDKPSLHSIAELEAADDRPERATPEASYSVWTADTSFHNLQSVIEENTAEGVGGNGDVNVAWKT